MRPIKRGIMVAIAVTFVGLPTDYFLARNKNTRVAKAVSECGGGMGSIPIWPLGTEYRITFRSPLTTQQLDRLTELNSLRGTVRIAFVDCELSDDEVNEAVARLPNCLLIKVNDNNSTRLETRP